MRAPKNIVRLRFSRALNNMMNHAGEGGRLVAFPSAAVLRAPGAYLTVSKVFN
jgi:hypothetical protein